MGHKKNQEKAELSIYQKALKVARAKGGEARRNVARLSGDIRSFDRPDILITAEGGRRIVGLEHFRVDHHIGRGKKVESKSARFSSDDWIVLAFCPFESAGPPIAHSSSFD